MVYLASPWKTPEGPVEAVFFLKPATEAVLKLPDRLRREVYQLLVTLLRGGGSQWHDFESKMPTGQVYISRVGSAEDSILRIAYAQLKEQLVILQVATRTEVFHRQQLETDFDVLTHVGLSTFGVRIEARPEDPAVVDRLEQAIDLYGRNTHRLVTVSMGNELDALLECAEREPQRLVQGNKNFVLFEKSQLQALAARRSATEVYQYLFEKATPTEPFEQISGTPLAPLLDLD